MKLAACEETALFDFASFCRIYVEYMCASAGNCFFFKHFDLVTKLYHLTWRAAILSGGNVSASKVNTRTGAFIERMRKRVI